MLPPDRAHRFQHRCCAQEGRLRLPASHQLHVDRQALAARPEAHRQPVLYRGRNSIERMFGRLKDFRRIATRYDRSAINFLAAVCLAATVSYWL